MADEFLGTDLSLALLHSELRPVYTVATEERSVGTGRTRRRLTDFARVAGRDNLAQAILLRLLTPRGELAALGHPEYGSRLHEVIGRTNTETTRHLVRLYVLESLKQEPRIAEVLEVAVAPSPGSRDRVEVLLRVLPLRDREPVDLGPFTLEL
jgi:phage baseplate assembly protein W